MAIDSTIALVTLAETKTFLKITGLTEDTVLENLIDEISQTIQSYLGRKLISTGYTEYYDGDGSDTLILNQFPVTALTSLNDDPNRAFGSTTAVNVTTDVILDGAAGVLHVWNGKATFFKGHGNIKAVYTAGYSVTTLPYDLQLATKLSIAQLYKIRYGAQRFGVKSETIADRTVSFDYEAFPAEAKQILDHYRELSMLRQGYA
jgi:uncharacterized phiE125 gp8 family phage protein